MCMYVSVHVWEIDWYPVLTVTWLIDVQSKHCSFACMPLEGRVNEATVARSACFYIIEREREGGNMQGVCVCVVMYFPH